MPVIIKQLLSVALLIGRPQDLPASQRLFAGTALAAFLIAFFLDRAHTDFALKTLFAGAQLALLGGWVWLVLALRGRPARWLQTMIALYGARTFVYIVAAPVIAAVPTDAQSLSPALVAALLVINLWYVAIVARVLRFATDLHIVLTGLISFVFLFLSDLVLLMLFPPTVSTAVS